MKDMKERYKAAGIPRRGRREHRRINRVWLARLAALPPGPESDAVFAQAVEAVAAWRTKWLGEGG